MTSLNHTPVPLARIRLDGGTQSRAETHQAYVRELALVLDELPPPETFTDGKWHWPGDGHHTILAHHLVGRTTVICVVHKGTARDALIYGMQKNAERHRQTQGLRWNSADKRAAAALLLADAEWSRESNQWIADRAGCGPTLIAELRAELSPRSGEMRVVRRGNQVYELAPARPEERLRLHQEADAAALAEGAEPEREGDGLRTLEFRVPVLIARLYDELSESRQRGVLAGLAGSIRKAGRAA